MAYKRLSFYERCKIQAMDEQGYQQKEIAEALGRSPSTISREFKRNKTIRWSRIRGWFYRGDYAQHTADRPRTEFAGHEKISKSLESEFYFAHPYSSWERGLNENSNGLLRQYLPKGTDFAKISHKELQQIEDEINNRPRKILGYRTPNEIFEEITIGQSS